MCGIDPLERYKFPPVRLWLLLTRMLEDVEPGIETDGHDLGCDPSRHGSHGCEIGDTDSGFFPQFPYSCNPSSPLCHFKMVTSGKSWSRGVSFFDDSAGEHELVSE